MKLGSTILTYVFFREDLLNGMNILFAKHIPSGLLSGANEQNTIHTILLVPKTHGFQKQNRDFIQHHFHSKRLTVEPALCRLPF